MFNAVIYGAVERKVGVRERKVMLGYNLDLHSMFFVV